MSFSKIRHIQETNRLIEENFITRKILFESEIVQPKVGDTLVLYSNREAEKQNSNKNRLGEVKITAIREQFSSGVVEIDVEISPNFRYPVADQIVTGISSLKNPNIGTTEQQNKKTTLRFSCKNGDKLTMQASRWTPIFCTNLTSWYLTNVCQTKESEGKRQKYTTKQDYSDQEKIWHVMMDGVKRGPFSIPQIITMMNELRRDKPNEYKISKSTLLWREGMPNWAKAETISDFQSNLKK